MMFAPSALWWHEVRRCGAAPLLLPVLAAAAIVLLAIWVQDSSGRLGDGGVRLTAMAFPAVAGVAGAAALGRERLVELHATSPTPYPSTVARRVAVLGAVVLVAAAVLVVALEARGLWLHPAHGLMGVVVPAAPAAFLIGLATWSTAVLRSAAAASMVVIAGWMFEIFFWDTYVAVWQVNRALLIVAGGALLLRGLHRMHDSEHLLVQASR